MPTFAAIDIGSNSCRLKIAKVVAHQLKTLAEDREVTRLGASVFESGLVSPEAMALTLRALKRFQRAVQAHGVDQIRVVATSAMRDARNGAAFQAWVKAETGWTMEIISGLEEGRLIHLGVTGTEPGAGGKVLLVDLGGGSCEITLSEHKRIKETISVPLGAVRLTEEFLQSDPAPADGLARMRQWIAARVAAGAPQDSAGEGAAGDCDLGHGGGAERCVCGRGKAEQARRMRGRASGRTQCRRTWCRRAAVRKLATLLAKMTLPEREAVPGIGPRRAEIIVAGAAGVCGVAGEFWAGGVPLFSAGIAGRHSGADAGRAGRASDRCIASSSTSGGRACWRRRGVTAWIPSRPSRCGRTRCNCFAS